jgi:1-acyl-sn-glycerol-3-phosphate acyltransferase
MPSGEALRQNEKDQAWIDERILEIVREVAQDARGRSLRPEPASRLSRDLGIDSLNRMELLLRLDREFKVSIPEQIALTADTPAELADAIRRYAGSAAQPRGLSKRKFENEGQVDVIPESALTLIEVLSWYNDHYGDKRHILLLDSSQDSESITYQQLFSVARKTASGLRRRGLESGSTVAIMLPTGADFFFAFFGILLAGGIPVPIYPPLRKDEIEDHLQRQSGILRNAQTVMLITDSQVQPVGRLLKARLPFLKESVILKELVAGESEGPLPQVDPKSTALIQYTSGSTGDPKGVVLSHQNLLSNVRVMGERVKASGKDVFVSWLPLYHDMGLIGAWLGSLYFGSKLVSMSPLSFIARPVRWLQAIHSYGGTLSAAPNFAYEICATRIDDQDLQGLDLSSWRVAFNGAEPVLPETIAKFTERFSKYGFRPEAMAPVYGLAENSVGLCFPALEEGPVIDRISKQDLQQSKIARQLSPESKEPALRIVSAGHALQEHEIRIVDEKDRELGEREEGHIQFKGVSATSGYYRREDQNKKLLHDGWLETGDLGYFASGRLYITGRVKDMIIRAGRNIYPTEVEEAVGKIDLVRRGCVAVFSTRNDQSHAERLVVAAETKTEDPAQVERIRKDIEQTCLKVIEIPPDDIALVPPRSIPKTPSGKIRRSASRELYQSGQLGAHKALWRQFFSALSSSVIPLAERAGTKIKEVAYGLWCYLSFSVLSLTGFLVLLVIPDMMIRRRCVKSLARVFLFLSGMQVRVKGETYLKSQEPIVAVSNHASYLDSIILGAVLPVDFTFVAKDELKKSKFLGFCLARIGTVFIERFDFKRSLEGAQQFSVEIDKGRSIVIFAEGTFHRAPGILPFKMGAFDLASRNAIAVLPLTIRGSRKILPAGSFLPERGRVEVIASAPLSANGSSWQDAVELKNRVREQIVKHSEELPL